MQQDKQIRYQVTLDEQIKLKAEQKAGNIGLKLNDVIRLLTTNFANNSISIDIVKPNKEFVGYELSKKFESQLREAEEEYKQLPSKQKKSYKDIAVLMNDLND